MVIGVGRDWEHLAVGVYRRRLPFLDVSVGLVAGSNGVVLIDCGTTPGEARDIAADVHTLTGRTVTDIVITHHHFDHLLGSAGFPAARLHGTGPVAAAVDAGADALREQALHYGVAPADLKESMAGLRPAQIPLLPLMIDVGDRILTVEHPGRGHTDHDLIVLVPGDPTVVFCGDLVEESADPAVDAGSDLAAWPHTLDRLLEIGGPDAVYVPGHGAAVDAEFVRRQRDWLRTRS